jgi:hypothetical protein
VPDPAKNVSLVFEWCGLTATEQIIGGVNTYYADEYIDEFVCDTTGRYGPEASYTQWTLKQLSVYIFPSDGLSLCGYKRNFIVSAASSGTGFRLLGGEYYGWENVILGENYACSIYQCFDGSEAVVTMTTSNEGPEGYGFSLDDTCGEAGNFEPCKFTAPQVTVVVAP